MGLTAVQDATSDLAAGEAAAASCQATVDAQVAEDELASAAATELESALQAVQEKQAYVTETTTQQQDAVLQVGL